MIHYVKHSNSSLKTKGTEKQANRRFYIDVKDNALSYEVKLFLLFECLGDHL